MTADRVVRGQSDRAWFRPNPPLPTVKWSLRNNINYQQSGILLALSDFADRRQHFLEQFYLLGKRSIAKAANEGPSAWVFDGAQKRQGQLTDLMSLLRTHGDRSAAVRRAVQRRRDWPPARRRQEDDKEAGHLRQRQLHHPHGPAVLASRRRHARRAVRPQRREGLRRHRLDARLSEERRLQARRESRRAESADARVDAARRAAAASTTHREQRRHLAAAPRLERSRTRTGVVADEPFTVETKKYAAGTIVAASSAAPSTKTHELHLPRVAILHTWLRTQDEGWFRLGARVARHSVQLHLDAGRARSAEPSRQIRRHPLRADRRQQLVRRNRERTSARPAAAVAQDGASRRTSAASTRPTTCVPASA